MPTDLPSTKLICIIFTRRPRGAFPFVLNVALNQDNKTSVCNELWNSANTGQRREKCQKKARRIGNYNGELSAHLDCNFHGTVTGEGHDTDHI